SDILGNIFRLVHTIKGTCGFLDLPRLEALAHAAETLMGKFRDGAPVTPESVSVILKSIDRIKDLLGELETRQGAEPEGNDHDLIAQLEVLSGLEGDPNSVAQQAIAAAGGTVEIAAARAAPEPTPEPAEIVAAPQERDTKPGEVSLDELERLFQEAPGLDGFDATAAAKEAAVESVSSDDDVSAPEAPAEIVAEAPAPTPAPEPVAKAKPKKAAKAKVDKPVENKGAPVSQQTIRVSVEALEQLMTMVSELVLTRNQLLEIARNNDDIEFKVPLQRLSNVTAELQEGVMKTRMQPIGNAWQKLPRIIRDLANELNKDIELDMQGQDTELDRQVLELIKDPLTHMVRNSADHGLETTEGRIAAGKPKKGLVRLSAYHEGGHIIIEIMDDGRGLDLVKIKQKALDGGLISETEHEQMTDQQAAKLIFHAGLSTAEKVTSVSGRGVGMDVVRNNIELIGGTVDVKTAVGEGSTFFIKIPLTLAIVSALIVEVSHERYAIPQLAVVELVRVQDNSEHRIERIRETPVLRLRSKLLPLVHLKALLGLEPQRELNDDEITAANDNGFIVVMQVGAQTFGVVVDAVFHTEEIVVKPMASTLRDISMFSGNTILGDGTVILIIDPNGIAQALGPNVGAEHAEAAAEEASLLNTAAEPVSLLLFRAGSDEIKAVPLSLITRLEEFDCSIIEHSKQRPLVQYRGSLMPLVFIDPDCELKGSGTQPMLVFTDDGRSMGLVVDDIVDIVEEVLSIEVPSDKLGVLGTAIIKERATEVIDIGYYLPQAFDDWLKRKDMPTEHLTKRVLLVDDSPFFRNMLSPVIKAAGYDVTVCDGVAEAMRHIEAGVQFRAVISDIEMPDTNGFEFAVMLRRLPEFASTPVIALSSLTTPQAIAQARESGFDDYVAKFDRPGLLASLEELISDMRMAA
ncbi:MAG: hybrid sensor histidine kinase/response regulator, partial [Rhizobiales bacterium]|nr:hybrid sensor histidine kinase/response regulator [Hyphomicrobiales bacterium]